MSPNRPLLSLLLLASFLLAGPPHTAVAGEPVGSVEIIDVPLPTPNLEPGGLLALGWPPVVIMGDQVEPGEKRDIALHLTESFAGSALDTPLVVAHGSRTGPTVCLTGGIHGDEINGMEIVRRVVDRLDPAALRGTVIGAPIVNLHGFQRGMRYLPDRRDLNRFFPGNPFGSSASRIANLLFQHAILTCDALVDFHTGSLHRTNLPQVRGDLRDPAVQRLARHFGNGVIVHNTARRGTLRRAATDKGIPAIIYEAGEPMRLQEDEIERGIEGTLDLLGALDMIDRVREQREPQPIYFATRWVRADNGGILRSLVVLGDTVERGALLGHVTNPVNKESVELRADHAGRIIGMSVSPIMIPGYAAYHLGIDEPRPDIVLADEEDVEEPEPAQDTGADEDERPE